jgi:hypothetical protein
MNKLHVHVDCKYIVGRIDSNIYAENLGKLSFQRWSITAYDQKSLLLHYYNQCGGHRYVEV